MFLMDQFIISITLTGLKLYIVCVYWLCYFCVCSSDCLRGGGKGQENWLPRRPLGELYL